MSASAPRMTAPPEVYQQRRAALGRNINRPTVFLAGFARSRNYIGAELPFRAGSAYLYFGGIPIEGAAWVIQPGCDGQAGCTLLRPPSGFDDAVWMGEAVADDVLARVAGVPISGIKDLDQIGAILSDRVAGGFVPPCLRATEWANACGLDAPTPEEYAAVADLRLVKDEHEIAAMRVAADIGVLAHRAAIEAAGVGCTEADVAAAHRAVLIQHQSHPSFTPIVTVHGEILHCLEFPNTLEKGKLLLIDAGAEEPTGYASDITRTIPVGGEYSDVQRGLYNVVLHAQEQAVAACKPGARFRDIHDLAARCTCEGLVEVGLLKGDPEALWERRAHTLFFTHGLGHLMGLDVHDMEDYGDVAGYAPGRTRREGFGDKYLRLDRDLQPGYVVTIEPGFYVVPVIWRNEAMVAPFADCVNRGLVDELLKSEFGGIRIEDDVLVTADGMESLTVALPKDADAIEAMTGAGVL